MKNLYLCLLSLGLAGTVFANESDPGENPAETQLQLRYRIEWVDQENLAEDAKASTLRTRLNFRSPKWNDIHFFIEADNVTEFLLDDFNSGAGTSPNRTQYPVVADPDGTEINQAYLQFTADNTQLRLGRQRILLDNQRFVGGVGWRQNEQTYDAFSVSGKWLAGSDWFYAYINNVNRIFGGDVAAGDHAQDTHLLNTRWSLNDRHKLTTYYYDIDNDDAAGFSTTTLGAKLNGQWTAGDKPINYALEFARQRDNSNNPVDYSANYWRLDAAVPVNSLTFNLGYEVLAGDAQRAGAAFRTPLATLHAFNGWADRFLATPNAGLKDWFVGIKGKQGKFNWNLVYHDFQTEDGSDDLGSELDASLARPINQRLKLLVKAARFESDTSTLPDTTKIWFMLSANLYP